MTDDEPDRLEPHWETVTPPEQEYARIGHALRKINEIDGVTTTCNASVEQCLKEQTTAEIGIVATDAVVDGELED